mgnify:CR=1 FL=1
MFEKFAKIYQKTKTNYLSKIKKSVKNLGDFTANKVKTNERCKKDG